MKPWIKFQYYESLPNDKIGRVVKDSSIGFVSGWYGSYDVWLTWANPTFRKEIEHWCDQNFTSAWGILITGDFEEPVVMYIHSEKDVIQFQLRWS